MYYQAREKTIEFKTKMLVNWGKSTKLRKSWGLYRPLIKKMIIKSKSLNFSRLLKDCSIKE